MTGGWAPAVILWGFLALAASYPFLLRAALELAEPRRERLVVVAERLVRSPRVPADRKEYVCFLVDHANDGWFMVGIALLFPLGVILALSGRLRDPWDGIADLEVRRDARHLVEWHLWTTAAANPLFALLVGMEFLMLGGVLAVLRLLRIPVRGAASMLAGTVFAVEDRLSHRHASAPAHSGR